MSVRNSEENTLQPDDDDNDQSDSETEPEPEHVENNSQELVVVIADVIQVEFADHQIGMDSKLLNLCFVKGGV